MKVAEVTEESAAIEKEDEKMEHEFGQDVESQQQPPLWDITDLHTLISDSCK